MAPLKEQIDNHGPKIAKGLAWGAVKGAAVGGLLFALNPLAGAVGAGVYYAKSMYNSYQENPNDEIHFTGPLRRYIFGTNAANQRNHTRGNLLGNLGNGGNNIPNNPNNHPATQLDGELNDIEARVTMRETQTRPPNTPSQLIIAQITANLAQQEHRLIGNTPRATGGNLWDRAVGNRIRNRRAERSVLERLNNIEDTQEQIRIMGRLTAIQNTMNTIRGRLGTPPPAINVGGNNMTRIPHTIGTPVSIDLRTARTDIHGNPILPLPAGVTITNITITDTTTGAAIMPHTPFDPTTQSFQLNPTTPGDHNYTITYTDSLGRTSPNLNFIVESQNSLAGVPLQPTINGLNTITNTVSYTTTPQQIHGTTSPNTTIELVDPADNVIATTTSGASGAYRIDTTIANGLHQNLRMRAWNGATPPLQNNSAFFNIDVNVPAATPTTPLLTPTINSNNLDQPIQTISGNTTPNARVEILNGTTPLQRATADASGNYTMDINLPNGTHNLTIRVTDPNDLSNIQDTLTTCTVNIPTGTPATTILAPTVLASNLDQETQHISGNTTPGMLIEIFDSSTTPHRLIQRGTADTSGNYDIPLRLNHGTHNLTITVSDPANTASTPQSRNESITVTYNNTTTPAPNTINTAAISQPTITHMGNTFRLSSNSNIPANTEIRMIKAGPIPTVLGRTSTSTSGQIQIDFTNNRRDQSITKRDIGLQYTDQNGNIQTEWFTIDMS